MNKRWLFYIVAALALVADIGSKWVVGRKMERDLLPGYQVDVEDKEVVRSVIAQRMHSGATENVYWRGCPFISLTWALNDGGIFGIGSGKSLFFAVASIVAIGVILWLLYSSPPGRKTFEVALGLILSGALGNLYDRIFLDGCVRDFLNFRFISWPAFNIADVAISVGCGLLILLIFLEKQPEQAEKEA